MNKSERSFRLAVIGAGGRGRMARLAHRPEDGFRLVAAADPDPAALEPYRKDFGPEFGLYTDHRELLDRENPDGVFVCSPDFLHEEQGLDVLRRGCTLYLEKPLAITTQGCDRLLDAGGPTGERLYVGHNLRFFPVFRKMHSWLREGRIGEVQAIWCRHFISYGGDAYFKDWHSERRFSTGLLLQKGSHDIDIIHWLAGSYTRRTTAIGKLSVYNQVANRRAPDEKPVTAFARENWPPLSQKGLSPVIDVEDHSMVLLELENRVQASYLQCHYTPDDHRNYTIIGTEGRIENCGDTSRDDRMATLRLWNYRCGYEEEGTEAVKIPRISGDHGGADRLIIDDFLHFLRTGERRGASPLDARMSVAAGFSATESLRDGGTPREVPPYQLQKPPSDHHAPG